MAVFNESLALRLPAESSHETELFSPDGPFSLYHYSVLRQTSLAAFGSVVCVSVVLATRWRLSSRGHTAASGGCIVCHPAAHFEAPFVILPHVY